MENGYPTYTGTDWPSWTLSSGGGSKWLQSFLHWPWFCVTQVVSQQAPLAFLVCRQGHLGIRLGREGCVDLRSFLQV